MKGLDIAVERHRQAALFSQVGRGSTFSFDVVVAPAEGDTLSSILSLDLARPPSSLSVALAVSHECNGAALAHQLDALGAPRTRLAPSELAEWLVHNRATHVFVDASAGVAELVPRLGGAQLLVCTRPAAARVPPPPGVAAFIGMPSRLAVVAEALGVGKKPEQPAQAKVALRVLVADDESTNRLVARAMLKSMGCTVDVVEDGAAAVDAASSMTYDIVFLDMQMPILSGCEAAARLRQLGYGGVILALTASVLEEERRACIAAGMNEVISKPIDRRTLHGTVLRYAPPPARVAA